MTQLQGDWTSSAADETVNFSDLSNACGMSAVELEELMEYGALQALNSPDQNLVFASRCIQPLRTAGKLRRDYDLDLFVVVILMDYLQRISALEEQLQSLSAQHGFQSR